MISILSHFILRSALKSAGPYSSPFISKASYITDLPGLIFIIYALL
jgi:hypothetical protein